MYKHKKLLSMKNEEKKHDEIHSVSVRAGKRTYFFDVRETRQGDHYLVLTESMKFIDNDGSSKFKRSKLFLYKEDFEKFAKGYEEAVDFIKRNSNSVEEQLANPEILVEEEN